MNYFIISKFINYFYYDFKKLGYVPTFFLEFMEYGYGLFNALCDYYSLWFMAQFMVWYLDL